MATHRRRMVTAADEQFLIPGLPDHIAQLCLSHVHPSLLYSVCHSWRRLIYSPSFPPFLSLYTVLSSDDDNSVQFFSFDPISSSWDPLPLPPQDPPLSPLLRHPSFISRHLPIQTVSASGYLIVLAATTHNFFPALSRPLLFNPLYRKWTFGPPLSTPRRWCAAGTSDGAVYVGSGIGSNFSTDVAKSVEKWDLSMWKWEKVRGLRDGRFSREAIDAVGWRGKLCMVNVKGDAAKEGIVYDVENDVWENMPEGMVSGWKGPVATMDEEVMYVVDETKGALRKYEPEMDMWEDIIESDDRLRKAQQIVAGGGRVCVICDGRIFVLDVGAVPVRMFCIDTPLGFDPVALHILPRLPRPEFDDFR